MSAWDAGDRVEIVATDHPWRGETGHVVGLADHSDLEWGVRLDSGEEVTAYSDELDGVITSPGGTPS